MTCFFFFLGNDFNIDTSKYLLKDEYAQWQYTENKSEQDLILESRGSLSEFKVNIKCS